MDISDGPRVIVKMALNTVKCNNCNIVISELLAFVQNKADVMDEVSIIRLCNTAFKSDEIVTAKKLLLESVTPRSRKITRKGEGKEKRDMEDILCIIKETDPECLPIFVARDLQRLPPVTFDHLDATRILRDIIKLQDDITVIKENYVTKEMLKESSPEVNNFVNTRRRGAGLMDSFECESGPIGLPHIAPDKFVETTDSRTTNDSQVPRCINTSILHIPTPKHCRTVSDARSLSERRAPGKTRSWESTGVLSRNNKKMYSEVAAVALETTHNKVIHSNTSQTKVNLKETKVDSENEWTLVQRKRNKFIGKKGTADVMTECKFKAADINIPFYIYNISKECPSTDIADYIKCKTGIEVSLERINMKLRKDYEAYKFMIPKSTLPIFMDQKLWPSGISFRRYVTFNKKWVKSDNNQQSSVTNSEPK